MEINKNMTRAEQIGHVYEYTSKYVVLRQEKGLIK